MQQRLSDLFMDQVALGTLTAADEYGFFDKFNDEGVKPENLARNIDCEVGVVDCVCRVLVSMGLLTKADENYYLTDQVKSYFLKDSPTYRGYQFYGNREHWAHKKVLHALKEGWSPIGQNNKSFTEMWEKGDISQEAADRFTSMMHTNIAGPATSIAKSGIFRDYTHVIDVGGGSGVLLAALAQVEQNKILTLMELPQVCSSAKSILEKYIDVSRINFHGANFFEQDWPSGADALFFSNILHDWPYEKSVVILKNAFSSVSNGGAIFVCECLLDEEKTSPKHTVVFDLMMCMNHRSQQYTKTELSSALLEVGFKKPEIVYTHGYYSVMKAEK